MAGEPTRPMHRSAAAVVLVRGHGAGLEVLLVERAAELRFFGGYHALPGGVRGPEDGADAPGDDLEPLTHCAVREVFEETGIALDPTLRALPAEARRALRRRLDGASGSALDGAELPWRRDRDPAHRASEMAHRASEMTLLCRICTPPFAPVRYDTAFFVARMPDGEELDVVTGELTGGAFVRPSEALARWRRGAIEIVPPVLILLELLVDGDLERFARRAAAIADSYAHGSLHRVRFSPGVVMASLRSPTLPPATTTNCLLFGEERLFVVDPATPYADEQERLFALLDDMVGEGRELGAILLTHHHHDHVGAVHATSARYGLPVRGHALTLARLAPGFLAGDPLDDGDRVELGTAPDGGGGWHLTAVFTPGHDRGHLCFRESRYAAVAAGDMLSTVSTIVIDPPEGHMRTYLGSLARLLDEPMGTLYPAHGPAARDGHRLVRHYLRHRAERERAIVDALAENAGATTAELVPRVYADTDARMFPLAERSLLAGLLKLVEDGVVRQVGDGFALAGADPQRGARGARA